MPRGVSQGFTGVHSQAASEAQPSRLFVSPFAKGGSGSYVIGMPQRPLAPARPQPERPQRGVTQDLRAATRIGFPLEGLIEQFQGAGAIAAIEGHGPFALAADVLGGELDGLGVDPCGVEEGLDL